MYLLSGAASPLTNEDAAWTYLEPAGVIVGVDADLNITNKITDWGKAYWNEVHPHRAGGSYTNLMMYEGRDCVKASNRQNYDRLGKIKTK